ncbi:protein FAR1-RELATED SEQUENCE 5-like [Aegilops tauschii subsp. strangulata]|uniref:protein FAR1-RELATED SEQUENCE 5-like n=1 Tax=Aegilops tauschii subsp. strangulata TaxID=200361 RepID=UPI001ABC9E34|nr:protein FAR-RED IMPAIRED RESPONSE 1-like [Aegilops tauschii subsp. strangulata]
MGKPRREIMFDTIDISNIACRDRVGDCATDIADTMKLLADMQRRRPGFHHVEETENNVVCSLFWTDSLCKMNYDLYADFVSFDTTFSTNIYALPFAPIIGVDNHGSTVLFGVGLLKDEKIGSFKWLLSTFVKAMGDQDEFERAWKAAISVHKAEGNKHLNTLWELRNFWVPAYFKDCFYPFSSTTTHSESTNSMRKNYVDHRDTIKSFADGYHMIQQNCLATLAKKRHRREEKAPSLETGFLIERQASQVYTNEIFRKFQLELRNRTYFKCSDLAKGRLYFFLKITEPGENVWKPYPGEEFDRSDFKVDVDEQKEIYSCCCKKMSRDGIQCCHVLKVMDQTGMIDQLPKSFVIPRWTRNLSESLKVLSTSQGDSMTVQDDETMRFGLAYTELSDICSNACRKEKAYRVLRECMVDMKIKVMAALAEEPDTGILAETLKNPPMSGSKGTKKGDRMKASSEKKGKGNKEATKCGRCRVKGHRKTNCPDNPEVQERMRIEEEKRKSQQEKRVNRLNSYWGCTRVEKEEWIAEHSKTRPHVER